MMVARRLGRKVTRGQSLFQTFKSRLAVPHCPAGRNKQDRLVPFVRLPLQMELCYLWGNFGSYPLETARMFPNNESLREQPGVTVGRQWRSIEDQRLWG